MSDDAAQPRLKRNHFAELLGMQLTADEAGHCHATLVAGQSHLNPNGVVHGGAVYTLADTSMGSALSWMLPPGEHCATIEIKITYYAPARAGQLSCYAHVTHRTRRFAFLEAEVRQEAHVIARATGTFAILHPRPAEGERPA